MKPIRNKKVLFEYEILDTIVCGTSLLGWEVKSLRAGNANLKSAWVSIKEGEAWMMNCQIVAYSHSQEIMDQARPRKLLLKRREIDKLERQLREQGRTLAVTAMFDKEGKIKTEIALVRGKKQYEKRATIKAREADRRAKSAMKNYR